MAKRMKKKKSSNKIKKKSPKSNHSQQSMYPNIPMYDFFEDHRSGTANRDPSECIESLLISIENGYFVTWDAVVAKEKGLLLSSKQKELINGLVCFSEDGHDDPTLYIDSLPRPKEPWYETLRKLAPELILEPFKTYEIHDEMYHEDWLKIVEILETYGRELTLPDGIDDPINVIPPDILHRLWLQYCFDELSGLGQEEELSLGNEDQKPWRINGFIERLKECKDSVEYLGLTMEQLFQMVDLPSNDEKILSAAIVEKLNIQSKYQKLHEVL